jgi:hypothetical protein
VNEPVRIVRPDDGPIGPKHVALYVLLMVLIDVLDENINTLLKQKTAVLCIHLNHVQGEHNVFPSLQTFITRKLLGIQTFLTVTQLKKNTRN